MKTKLIIAAATVAGALLIQYFLKKAHAAEQIAPAVPLKKSHHLTNVFAHAKNHID